MLDKHRLISEGDTPKRATLICYTWCLVIAIQTDKINVSYYLTILKDKTNSKQTVHSTNSTKYYKAVSSRCVPSTKIAHCKTLQALDHCRFFGIRRRQNQKFYL